MFMFVIHHQRLSMLSPPSGVMDNSGLRFYYTTQARAQDAGIMYLGHLVTRNMVVPPRTNNFTIAGICTAECTSAVRSSR